MLKIKHTLSYSRKLKLHKLKLRGSRKKLNKAILASKSAMTITLPGKLRIVVLQSQIDDDKVRISKE